MKKSRFSEEQIAQILAEQRAGAGTSEVCRRHGISAKTFYGWRARYGGMVTSEVRRVRALEEENAKLKRIVASQAVDILAMKDVLTKKW